MEVLGNPSANENERTRYLIQVAQASSEQAIAFPLARITTCGTLNIQILQAVHVHANGQQEAIYGPPDPALLAKKGASTAFTLLALLASQPGSFAKKDWLSEKLGHCSKEEDADGEGLKRVDNVVSRLRFLLYPPRAPESEEEQLLRRRLVAYRRASGESGPGYQLAGMPLVWLDVAEIEAHIKRARRLEQFGEDGLTEWQAAYELAIQGSFLPGEVYSDWAEWRRQQVETSLWDCVQVLWKRRVEQGAIGETEALRILRDYWQNHVTSEDALRPLLELLGKRECFGEAQASYEQFCAALAVEGKQPDQRTRDIIEFQQAFQIQRKQQQSVLDENIDNERRKLLKEIGFGIGATGLAILFPNAQLLARIPEQIQQYQEQVPLHWDGYFTAPGQSAITAFENVILDLQHLSPYINTSQQEAIQMLLCQYHQLAADQLRDRGRIRQALEHGDLAVYLAEHIQHVELLAAALYRRGLTYFDAGQIGAAFRDLSDALPFARISRPQLKGMVSMEAGRFQAHLARSERDEGEAKRLLDQTEHIVHQGNLETDAGYVKLNQGRYHIGRAATLLVLKQPQGALNELQFAEQLTPREYQRRRAYINILRARSYFSQHQYDQAAHLALDTFHMCQMVHSESNIADIARLYNEFMQSPFAQAPVVQRLGFQIRHQQKGALL